MIIPNAQEWCKAAFARIPTHVLVVIACVLAVSLAFGLGVIAGKEMVQDTPGIQFLERATSTTPMTLQAGAAAATLPEGGEVVASKTGTKYYFPWCGTAKRIKEENKVWFASRAEAEAAGYEPAANCKGL